MRDRETWNQRQRTRDRRGTKREITKERGKQINCFVFELYEFFL